MLTSTQLTNIHETIINEVNEETDATPKKKPRRKQK